jgi:hypothetical protein
MRSRLKGAWIEASKQTRLAAQWYQERSRWPQSAQAHCGEAAAVLQLCLPGADPATVRSNPMR